MTKRIAIAEVVRALAVLALVFLNFAHAPLANASAGGPFVGGGASYCGDAAGGDKDGTHAPCDACRVGGGADLAPPCPVLVDDREVGALAFGPGRLPLRHDRSPARVVARGAPAA